MFIHCTAHFTHADNAKNNSSSGSNSGSDNGDIHQTELNCTESTAKQFRSNEKDSDDSNDNNDNEHFGEWHAIWVRLCKMLCEYRYKYPFSFYFICICIEYIM